MIKLMNPQTFSVGLFDCPAFAMFSADDCHRANNILHDKRFEPMSMKLWCDKARDATAILDIGAQVGVYSLAACALRQDIPVHAFEPNPDAFARLALHRRINEFSNMHCHREALANFTGITSLSWVVKGELISSGASFGGGIGRQTVPCVADILDRYQFDMGTQGLVKIDVEGAEINVLEGARRTISTYRPDIILETFAQSACDLWNSVLRPLGYNFWKVMETDMRAVPVAGITPCDKTSGDFNHFLSVRGLIMQDGIGGTDGA